MSANNRTSNLVSSQLPFFVRNDHPTFVRFLEAYYEYLEQNSKVIERAKKIREFRDIDRTEDDFTLKLYDEFLKNIPESAVVDKALLLKNIKDFYRAKGTEKAVRFLMRILFNKEISIYYPKRDVLRASDGKWFVQKSLRINNTRIDSVANTNITGLEKYVGTQITGITTETTALVERVDRFFEQGTQIDELILSNIDGEFDSGEEIETVFNDGPGTREITSNIFGGIINTITIVNGGLNYEIGDPVVILSSTGSGACAAVASVTTGNIASVIVNNGGAGYRVGRQASFSGGGGTGANGVVGLVNLDETIHPNTYNIVSSTISLEANTALNNVVYTNLNSSTINTTIANAVSYWTYANTGPITSITLTNVGQNYTTEPTITVAANTVIYQLGILGRMEIVDGGQNYRVGDTIEFINPVGTYGTGAQGNVISVGASNTITGVRFAAVTGFLPGGSGFSPLNLPRANVITSTGNGANIMVTAILSSGANLSSTTGSIGAITRIMIFNRGRNYTPNTTIDLTGSGDGNATATAIAVEGVFSYPGRYLNDDGHISSYNFLQNRDYYQDFSYVIRSSESIDTYRKSVKDTVHPAGMKLFGEHLYINEDDTEEDTISNNSITITKRKTFIKTANTVNISYASHNVVSNSTITLEFLSGASNLRNGIYTANSTNPSYLTVAHSYFAANTSGNVLVGITR